MEALRIKELREEAGYTKKELAQAMDVSHVTVIQIGRASCRERVSA